MSISLKECREIIYWLNIAKDSNFINSDFVDRILVDANELKALLTSIINKTKQNLIS